MKFATIIEVFASKHVQETGKVIASGLEEGRIEAVKVVEDLSRIRKEYLGYEKELDMLRHEIENLK